MRVYDVIANGREFETAWLRLPDKAGVRPAGSLDPIRKGHAAETGNGAAPGKAWRGRPGR